jgi:Holliday junction resolvase RusA-like endonuclease
MEFNTIKFEITPCPKPRMTQRDKWLVRPPVARYRIFKSGLEALALENKFKVQSTLSLTFVLNMPNSWSKKKKAEFNGKPHQQKPDLDNLIKAFKDALCEDDSYVHIYERMRKIWGEEDYILIHNSYKNE